MPGDIVQVRLGDLIPADLELVEGDHLSIDQSARTGASLPVERHVGELAYSGPVAEQGEMAGMDVLCSDKTGTLTRNRLTLGVARGDDGKRSTLLVGVLSLFDPPRDDAAETLAQAARHGIQVKMVTGDNEAIAKDNTWLDSHPVRWDMRRVLTVASVLGAVGVPGTFLLLSIAIQGAAVLIVGLGLFVTPLPWAYIGLVWGGCLVWLLAEDLAKRLAYTHPEAATPRHRRFLDLARRPLSVRGNGRKSGA